MKLVRIVHRMNVSQVRQMKLATLLRHFEIKRPKVARRHNPTVPMNKLNYSQLWDLFEAAKIKWMELVKRLHPDKGGDTHACAIVNEIWSRIKILFARMGIA